ncbi:MAG: hypothetical protein H0W55_14005 [Actinobacteria bacterium]|nr:hypothetical protein [Actinomycetota bacterium]MDQ3533882.1 hypothetical protein [Actinomycetota bacterium]
MTRKQSEAARRNIKKAQKALRAKETITHLPDKVRSDLGREQQRRPDEGDALVIPTTINLGLSSMSERRSWVSRDDRRWGKTDLIEALRSS